MLVFLLIFVPLICSFISLLIYQLNKKAPQIVALLSVFFCFFISLLLFFEKNYSFKYLKNFKFLMYDVFFPWIPDLGISFHLQLIDNFSLLMIIVASIISIFAVLCEWDYISINTGFFYFLFLIMLTGIFGIFLSVDLFLFFLFWEVSLIPMCFFIIFFGKTLSNIKDRIKSAYIFFIYSQISSLILLFTTLLLVWLNYKKTRILTFDYFFLKNLNIPLVYEIVLLIGFFLSFSIKMPIFPFHNWLPRIQKFTPSSGSIDLIGILLKTAVYGLVRFNSIFFPSAIKMLFPYFFIIGLITIIYGSVLSFFQKNIKNFISYSSISHMGLILISIYNKDPISHSGMIIYFISNIFITSALVIISGIIENIFKTRNINKINSFNFYLYKISMIFLFFIFLNLGIPGTGIFTGEVIILFSLFKKFPVFSILVMFSLLLQTIYSLMIIHRIFYGFSENSYVVNKSLSIKEKSILSLILSFSIFIGLYPIGIIDIFLKI